MRKILLILSLAIVSFAGISQSVDGGLKTLTAAGTNTYTISEAQPAAYDPKERFIVKFTNVNSTAATLNRAGLGAKAIKKPDGTALTGGELLGYVLLSYNGTYYQIVGGVGSGGSDWGDIAGMLSDQTDLQSALNAKQSLDSDLTSIAGLSPSNDDIIQRKAGAWTNRTIAQLKTDLSLSGSNTGDQDLSGYLTTSTAASTYQPLDSDLTSWAAITRASGINTWVTTPSSSNLAGALTDESGTTGGFTRADYVDAKISDTAYGSGWDGDTGVAPSKNAMYDKIETVVTASTNVRIVNFDGQGSVVLVGTKTYFRMKSAGTFSAWSIIAEGTSPTCTIDIWKVASGTALPTVANTIIGAGTKPALATGNAIRSTTFTSWTTTSWSANDIICVNVDLCTAGTKIIFQWEQ
jgi:hypothetical protein